MFISHLPTNDQAFRSFIFSYGLPTEYFFHSDCLLGTNGTTATQCFAEDYSEKPPKGLELPGYSVKKIVD